ncbi:MAG TPA: FHA domain-containing protein [Terriglobales bacterium]|nr:FHA domain-containing protein [Terriglobales bacterium]
MAAKLILSMDGTVLKEYPLNKERMTIGRRPHNDIVIDNLAISGEHAAIITILHDSFLEDLNSTNGVEVNGVQVKKHFLQNNDLIELGKYKLKYINDQVTTTTAADFERTMVMRAPVKPIAPAAVGESLNETQVNPAVAKDIEKTGQFEVSKSISKPAPEAPKAPSSQAAPQAAAPRPAVVQILTGPNAGKELELVKNLTTLGKPGVQVAVLTRRPHGFFITHVEGAQHPSVNGEVLGDQPHELNDHDMIELAGIKMEFYFKD